MSDNPYQPTEQENFDVGSNRDAIKKRVFGPSIAMIIAGALGVSGAIFGAIQWGIRAAGIYPSQAEKDKQLADLEEQLGNTEWWETVKWAMEFQDSPVNLLLNALSLAIGIAIIVGGVKMKNLQSYGLSMTAAILTVVPIFTCCCYGLPIGIWAIVVLMSGDVKAAFRRS